MHNNYISIDLLIKTKKIILIKNKCFIINLENKYS